MKHGKTSLYVVMAALCLTGTIRTSQSSELTLEEENSSLNLDGRLQLLGVLEQIDDPWKDSERVLLFLKQARLNIHGVHHSCDYALQLQFGGEEKPENNSVMSLLDAYFNVPFVDDLLEVKVGQFRMPYGRERLFDSGTMFNTDRSIHNLFFNLGRDVGGAIHSRKGVLSGAAGVFTGGGINIPQRYIPEDLGFPMIVARLGVNNGLDKDVFTTYQNDDSSDSGVRFAAYLNGMYTKDSRVGHSTPLNVKYSDVSIFVNPNWNPYLAAANQKATFAQYGVDAAVQVPISETKSVLFSVEANTAQFENDAGELKSYGGVASMNLLAEKWNMGVRYAAVKPDADFAYTSKDATTGETTLYPITDKTIQEITPSVGFRLSQFGIKIITELSIQLDVPVARETGHGVYNLMLQPDQVSYIAKGKELQDVYVGRVMVQYDF